MRDKIRNWIAAFLHQVYIRRYLLLVIAGVAAAVFGLVKLIGYIGDMVSSRRTNEEIREIYYAEGTETPAQEAEATSTIVWNTPQVTPVMETPVSSGSGTPTETPVPAETSGPTETPVPEQETVARLETVDYPGNPDLKIDNRFKHLRTESKYIVGWLNIDRLIDEAVVQRNNTFYLDHDVYGKENVNGAIFMDAVIHLEKQPFGYLLYGHNMKTGEKFGCLRNYENSTFYHANPMISFETMYESGHYVIFSVGNISTKENDRHYMNPYALIYPEIPARQEAIDILKQVSVHTCTIDVQPEDQFLLLITCVANEDERRVVAARRVRAGESEEELKTQILRSGKK